MKKRYDSKRRLLRPGEYEKKTGGFEYRYQESGKSKTVYSRTLGELREIEKEIEESLAKGLDYSKRNLRVKDLAKVQFARKKKILQPTTYSTMINMYNLYIRDYIGDMIITEVKRSHIMDYYIDLLTGNDEWKGISIVTLSRVNTIVKPIFQNAVYDEIILRNPVDGVYGELKRSLGGRARKISALTEEEQAEFLSFLNESSNHECVKNMFIVLLGTGCRVGEIVGLRWDDVDFKKNTISINHSVGYLKKEDHYAQIIKKPKTAAGTRTIPMLSDVKDALLDERKRQFRLGTKQPVIGEYTNFIFLSEKGTIYTRENVWHHLHKIVDEYNLVNKDEPMRYFTTHQLRHTFATRLCRTTSDLKSIQNILGHSDISTTMNIYAEATEDGVEETMQSLEGVLFKKEEADKKLLYLYTKKVN